MLEVKTKTITEEGKEIKEAQLYSEWVGGTESGRGICLLYLHVIQYSEIKTINMQPAFTVKCPLKC